MIGSGFAWFFLGFSGFYFKEFKNSRTRRRIYIRKRCCWNAQRPLRLPIIRRTHLLVERLPLKIQDPFAFRPDRIPIGRILRKGGGCGRGAAALQTVGHPCRRVSGFHGLEEGPCDRLLRSALIRWIRKQICRKGTDRPDSTAAGIAATEELVHLRDSAI
jgi:hypothetical protein